nr:uncharacterized protein LOC124498140 [Dermatophagoides farinae]
MVDDCTHTHLVNKPEKMAIQKTVILCVSFGLMMIITSLLVATVVDAIKTEDECLGEFEFWSCQSSTRQCQRICENKGVDKKKLKCDGECQRACVCEAGYLRDGIDGECVYDTECNLGDDDDDDASGKVDQIQTESTTTTTTTTARPVVNNRNIGKKLADVKKNKPKRYAGETEEYARDEIDDTNEIINGDDDDDDHEELEDFSRF